MSIDDIRREYLLDGLDQQQLKKNPFEQFKLWLDQACDSGIADPTAMSVATVDEHGMPSLRTVLLKSFDDQGFVFYTNLESRKARELKHNPNISLLFPWTDFERQVIVRGEVELVSKAQSLSYFLSRPRDSQLAAWAARQSSPISSRQLLEEKFLEIKNKFKNKDISLPEFWGGIRIKPVTIEFWQGRKNRLHDRFVYQQDDAGRWQVGRLEP